MMRDHNQVPEAGDMLETWIKEAGFDHIKTETRSVDVGGK
jgi:hypothetical protein